MKFINDSNNLQNQNLNQTKFDKTGNVTSSPDFYAEMIISGNSTNYFIKSYAGTLHDPFGPHAKRTSTLDLKIKKVSQKTFNNYIEYLRTKNLKYFTAAQRGFIDDRA